MDIIQQKINSGKGFVHLETEGMITAELYDEKTDKIKNSLNWEYWQSLQVLNKPIKSDYKIIEDNLLLKTNEDKKLEKYIKIQNEILNDPVIYKLIDGIHKQNTSINIPGVSATNIIFTATESADWLNWYYSVAKNNHDLKWLSIEQITPALFGEPPAIPDVYKKIIEK
jgi:hypothetical protein